MKVSVLMIENPVEGTCDKLHQSFSDSSRAKFNICAFVLNVLPYLSGKISTALKERRSFDTGKLLKSRSIHIKISY